MKAALFSAYGPPSNVRIGDVPPPTRRRGQVLVDVRAAALTAADARIRGARFPPGFGIPARMMFGLTKPRRQILGSNFSGTIAAVGPEEANFAVGDEVCGTTGLAFGAHAEQLAVATKRLVRKPASITHDDAAAVLFGGCTALHFLRDKATVGDGVSVLVNGASGAVGTNAVQLARHFGATVTGVTSTPNVDLVKDLGATTVIDYTTTDLDTIDERFDVVFDTVGTLTIQSGRALLTERGVVILAVAGLAETLRARGNAVTGTAPDRPADMAELLGLMESGALRAVIDHAYDLDDIASAHERADSGRKVGNIVVHPRQHHARG